MPKLCVHCDKCHAMIKRLARHKSKQVELELVCPVTKNDVN